VWLSVRRCYGQARPGSPRSTLADQIISDAIIHGYDKIQTSSIKSIRSITKIQDKDALMDKMFHEDVRRRLAAHMTDGDAMLFFSGESVRKTADENFPFFTNRNFLYLTGIKQEQSALLIQKKKSLVSECLFVLKPDFQREIWTGRRFTEDEINEISGVEAVEDINALSRVVNELLSSQQVMTLWLCFDSLAPERSFDFERDFAQRIQDRHPHVVLKNSYPLLAALRKIKTPEEMDAIRKAMKITEAGIRRLMRIAKPGMREYELESEFRSELAAHGQRHTAFPPSLRAGSEYFICTMQTPCPSWKMAG